MQNAIEDGEKTFYFADTPSDSEDAGESTKHLAFDAEKGKIEIIDPKDSNLISRMSLQRKLALPWALTALSKTYEEPLAKAKSEIHFDENNFIDLTLSARCVSCRVRKAFKKRSATPQRHLIDGAQLIVIQGTSRVTTPANWNLGKARDGMLWFNSKAPVNMERPRQDGSEWQRIAFCEDV